MMTMRLVLAIFWCLLALSLATAGADSEVSVPVARTPDWPTSVRGFGTKEETARKDALRETALQIEAYLRGLQPPLLDWKPSEDFVHKNLVQGKGYVGPDVKLPDGLDGKTWILTLKRPDLSEFTRLNHQALLARQSQERQALSEHRLLLAGRVFALVLVAQAVVFCYHRMSRLRTLRWSTKDDRKTEHVVGK